MAETTSIAERLVAAYEKAHRVEAATPISDDIQAATVLRMAVGSALALLKMQGQSDEAAKASVRDVMRLRLRITARALHRKYLRLQSTAAGPRQPLAETPSQRPRSVLESIRRTARASLPSNETSAVTLPPPPSATAVEEATARKVAAEKLAVLKCRRRREYILQTCLLLETQSFLKPSSQQDVREQATAVRRLAQYLQSLTLQLDPVCQSINVSNRDQEGPSNFRSFVNSLCLVYGDLPALRALSEDFDLDLSTAARPTLPDLPSTQRKLVRRSSSFSEASPRKRSRREFDRDVQVSVEATSVKLALARTPAWKSNSTGTFITRSNSAPTGASLARRVQGSRGRSSGMVLHTVTVTSRRPAAASTPASAGLANPRKVRRK